MARWDQVGWGGVRWVAGLGWSSGVEQTRVGWGVAVLCCTVLYQTVVCCSVVSCGVVRCSPIISQDVVTQALKRATDKWKAVEKTHRQELEVLEEQLQQVCVGMRS